MMAAASEGKSDCVEKLIKKGTNVNSTDFCGDTALHWAVQAHDDRCVAYLIKAGADVNPQFRNSFDYPVHSPLLRAAENCDWKNISQLIDAGANVNANVDDYTPLLAASCTSNHKSREVKKKSLQILIKGGADVNMSGYERSPLMACAEVGSTEGLQVLIDAGAEVSLSTNSGRTALIGAATSVHIDCMETLIKAGADVNRQNNRGDTVLLSLTAVINFNRTDFERLCGIKLLLKSGARINIRNNLDQNTLEDYIMKYKEPDQQVLLLLSAAGEMIDNSQLAKVVPPYCLRQQLDDKMHMKRMCRNAIRKHLLHLDPHSHLASAWPLLYAL